MIADLVMDIIAWFAPEGGFFSSNNGIIAVSTFRAMVAGVVWVAMLFIFMTISVHTQVGRRLAFLVGGIGTVCLGMIFVRVAAIVWDWTHGVPLLDDIEARNIVGFVGTSIQAIGLVAIAVWAIMLKRWLAWVALVVSVGLVVAQFLAR